MDAILNDFIAHKDSALKSARFINGAAYLNTIVKLLPAQPSEAQVLVDLLASHYLCVTGLKYV